MKVNACLPNNINYKDAVIKLISLLTSSLQIDANFDILATASQHHY